jgi:hypothetical protein
MRCGLALPIFCADTEEVPDRFAFLARKQFGKQPRSTGKTEKQIALVHPQSQGVADNGGGGDTLRGRPCKRVPVRHGSIGKSVGLPTQNKGGGNRDYLPCSHGLTALSSQFIGEIYLCQLEILLVMFCRHSFVFSVLPRSF